MAVATAVEAAFAVAARAVPLVQAAAQLPRRRWEGDVLSLLCVEDNLVVSLPGRRRAGRVLHDREVHLLHLPVGVEGDVAGEELDERRAAECARHGGRLERARSLDGVAQGAERREGPRPHPFDLGRVRLVGQVKRAQVLVLVLRAVPAGEGADLARHRRVPRHRLQRILALPPAPHHPVDVLVVEHRRCQDGGERRVVLLLLLQAEPLQLLHRDDAAGLVRADEDDGGALVQQMLQRAPHLPPVLVPRDAAPLWNRRVRYDAGAGRVRRSRQDPHLGIPPLSLGAAADRPRKSVLLLDVPDSEGAQAGSYAGAAHALLLAVALPASIAASVAVLGSLQHRLEAAPRPVLAARQHPKHAQPEAVLLRQRGGRRVDGVIGRRWSDHQLAVQHRLLARVGGQPRAIRAEQEVCRRHAARLGVHEARGGVGDLQLATAVSEEDALDAVDVRRVDFDPAAAHQHPREEVAAPLHL
mmetsp:Transcript_34735/g.115090  ORF Transcript_34735/g.115090 Transcript_34735/m.115090 type:complete len:471 (-) Transcript_34735:344-1756(-)